MKRKFTAFVAAAVLAATALAPTADAQRYRGWGGYERHYGGYGHYRGYYGGQVAAIGVVGLVLGLALGSAISSDHYDRGGCYNPCGAYPPAPPPQYRGYDPGRGGPPPDGSAYEQDYGVSPKLEGAPQGSSCTHAERQWDRYANRYVTVEVPC